jgi:hypothetical protein
MQPRGVPQPRVSSAVDAIEKASRAMNKTQQPTWWTSKETNTWDRMKEALRRDWEQTKHDFSSKAGHELHQDVKDTVKQAAGKEAIPPANLPNPPVTWGDEAAVRFGYGVGISETYRVYKVWDQELEAKLQRDWESTNPERPWRDVRDASHFGWTRSQVDRSSKS